MSSIDYDLSQQTALQPSKLVCKSADATKALKVGEEQFKLEYDITGTMKTFEIGSGGVIWTNGVDTHTTGLERLALVQTAFQAVELPPNATTLKINDTLLLDAGVANQTTSITDGTAIFSNAGTGGLADPQITLNNNNTSATLNVGFPTIEMYKSGRNAQTGENLGSISVYGNDGGSQKTEFARIQVKTENVASGNEDGTMSIFTSVNGVNSEVFNFNGAQNENNTFRPLDLNANPLITSSGNLSLTATGSSGSGTIYFRPKEVGGTETIIVPLSSAPSDEFVIEKSANYVNFYQNGGALLNSNTQLRLGGGGLRLITINPSVAPTFGLDNGAFATATHQYSGNNYNLALPTSLGTLSTTNVSTLSLNSPNTTITNPSGQLNINANTNIVLSGNFNTFASTSSLDIQTPLLTLTGAGLQSATSSGNSGQHLVIVLNGNTYKIKLELP